MISRIYTSSNKLPLQAERLLIKMANGYVVLPNDYFTCYRTFIVYTRESMLIRHHSWSILIGFVVVALASAAGWFLSPKGETQTYVLSIISRSATFIRLNDSLLVLGQLANLFQNLAKLSDSLFRKLLSYVGYASLSFPPSYIMAPRL